MNLVQTGAMRLMQALGLFTSKAHPITVSEGIGGAAPAKKVRKIGYGESLRAQRTTQQLAKLNSKKAQ